jgi:hypothetical protein
MKIVTCPKGGRIPEGYCKTSCLNYQSAEKKRMRGSLRELKKLFTGDGRTWLQIYKEDIAPRSRRANCGKS